ncbi:MAG: tRNA (adenosine(37)-N6)-threonylcarbamoyltransferase complex transferase subunit TsaD [Nitrospina sp.]|nr:tRNA (adenosine(37)-N6)-threonylcarbamoyltransferase complex transferase subunit TsaD [Nitrospina sp.]
MRVLGIETSCDETAAAVLENGDRLLSNVIWSQHEVHGKYGGIVPELAGRRHVETVHLVIEEALRQADVTLEDIDLIGVTNGPGLVVSLLVGVNTAKALGYACNLPVVGINHLEGHLLAIMLQEPVAFPFLALIVSGGHTDLVRADAVGDYKVIGRTRDDAAGESFDKVAKMLGLGYPGGPLIERAGREGNAAAFDFPRSMMENGNLDFSFSGLKSAVRRLLEKYEAEARTPSTADVAASFQEAAVDVLVAKLFQAAERENLKRLVLTGGVAANGRLRQRLQAESEERGYECFIPRPVFCTDNAAMIAAAAYNKYRNHSVSSDVLTLDASSNLAF